jgi:Holliday junction DNA helicase RuvA
MIASLQGQLIRKSPVSIVINVQGVGYLVYVSLPTYYGLPGLGSNVSIRIYTIVREDDIRLFGFSSEREQLVFEKLISISKVGPKLAISILSGMSVEDFLRAISNKDIAKLNGIPGVGSKTAERLALELQDKLKDITLEPNMETLSREDSTLDDALSALLNLGYKKPQAEKALKSVYSQGEENNLESLIKRTLLALS